MNTTIFTKPFIQRCRVRLVVSYVFVLGVGLVSVGVNSGVYRGRGRWILGTGSSRLGGEEGEIRGGVRDAEVCDSGFLAEGAIAAGYLEGLGRGGRGEGEGVFDRAFERGGGWCQFCFYGLFGVEGCGVSCGGGVWEGCIGLSWVWGVWWVMMMRQEVGRVG